MVSGEDSTEPRSHVRRGCGDRGGIPYWLLAINGQKQNGHNAIAGVKLSTVK